MPHLSLLYSTLLYATTLRYATLLYCTGPQLPVQFVTRK